MSNSSIAHIFNILFFIFSFLTVLISVVLSIFTNRSENDKEREIEIRRLEANVSIDKAQSLATIASAEAAKARERASLADERAEIANSRAAELERQAAIARLETERIKQRVSWRTISSNNISRITDILKSNDAGRINICALANDAEAKNLAIILSRIFLSSGWQVGVSDVSFTGGSIFGIFIDQKITSLDRVLRILEDDGLKVTNETRLMYSSAIGSYIEGAPTIYIGSKPQQ